MPHTQMDLGIAKCHFVVGKQRTDMKKNVISLVMLVAASALNAQVQNDLPTIAITTSTQLNAQRKVEAHMTTEGYDGAIGIKLRGNSSLGFNQKKYTIETRDADGEDMDVSLFGLPAHSDWVLLAPYCDVSMLRDPLAFQLWRDMGHWGPRTVMCEVTMDGSYRGIYILSEAIRRGVDRVNISKLKKTDTSGRELTGGYLLRIDTSNEDDATFVSKVPGIGEGTMTSEVIWSCFHPKRKNLQPEQLAYIQSYVDTVEQVIQSDYFADPVKGYARYIDVPSFVDYFIHTELSLNADAYRRSAYFYKEKQKADGTGGKLFAGPVWDYNYAYGNSNLANADEPESWCYEGGSNNPTPALWQRLLQDPNFRKAVKKRYQALRKNVLSNKAINTFIDRQVKLLAKAVDHHFQTYPELLVTEEQKQNFEKNKKQNPMGGMFPPMGGFPPMGEMPQMGGFPPIGEMPQMGGFPPMGEMPQMGGFPPMGGMPQMGGGMPSMVDAFAAYRVCSYEEEIKVFKQWLADRLAFLDRQIARFDKDWEPRIQPLVEKKMQFPFGGFPMGPHN